MIIFSHFVSRARKEHSNSICLSIYGRTISDLCESTSQALAFRTGYLELRLDYLHSAFRNLAELPKIEAPSNQILTFRSKDEGGVSKVSDRTRKRILLKMISNNPGALIDIEIDTLKSIPEILDSSKSSLNARLIASSHNFTRTEEQSLLEDLVIASVKQFSPSIVKIVRQANDFGDNMRLLSLYKLAERISPTKLVAFCSGPLGIFSRIACVSFGSPFTFASLPGKKTAAGQLDVESMAVLLDSWETNQR